MHVHLEYQQCHNHFFPLFSPCTHGDCSLTLNWSLYLPQSADTVRRLLRVSKVRYYGKKAALLRGVGFAVSDKQTNANSSSPDMHTWSLVNTLKVCSSTSGAKPGQAPSDPPITPATKVPCPKPSSSVGSWVQFVLSLFSTNSAGMLVYNLMLCSMASCICYVLVWPALLTLA